MSKVGVRYIVNDVDEAIPFYTEFLGFQVDMHPGPGFARISRGDMQLFLNRPGARVTGNGGKQILFDDPSGNSIELFQPNR